jgi:thiol-disulfide isomerase/thioredoxin
MSRLRLLAAVSLFALVACDAAPIPVRRDPAASPSVTAAALAPAKPLPTAEKTLHFVPAPITTDLAGWIAGQKKIARAMGEQIVVYMGASWCEPCKRFHEAVEARELDGKLPPMRFLQFDAEQHGEQLVELGYTSKYVPLFAVPGDDGKSIGRQISGSIKGAGAPDEIAPRLKNLVEGKPTQ